MASIRLSRLFSNLKVAFSLRPFTAYNGRRRAVTCRVRRPLRAVNGRSKNANYRARGAYSTWLTRGQHAKRLAYKSTFPSEYFEDGHGCFVCLSLLPTAL